MKMFEKIGSMKTSEEVHHFMYGIFCNRFKTCKLCPLSSINRPDRYYEDEKFEEKCNQLKNLLLNNGAESVTFEDRKDKWYYIDHREELDTLFDEMLENIDLLLRFFNAEIITGNDNDDSIEYVEKRFSEYTKNGYECYWKGN